MCGQFGFTRPIQDYGSGPGTPLAHKLEGWDGLGRRMVAVSAKSWGLPPASMSLDSPDMMGQDWTCR